MEFLLWLRIWYHLCDGKGLILGPVQWIQSLAWELPCATGAAKKTNTQTNKLFVEWVIYLNKAERTDFATVGKNVEFENCCI